MREKYTLEEVFNEAAFPEITFVKSKYYREIRSSIRAQGKHITISGPSGSGKTTLLKGLLRDLNIAKPEYHEFNGRSYPQNESIIEILALESNTSNDFNSVTKELAKYKFIIIDDFHHLSSAAKMELANLLKLWHEKEIRFILVGIASSAAALTGVDPELGIRNDPYELKEESDEFINELIKLGEGALNVNFSEELKCQIIIASKGVPSIAQVICRIACITTDVEETFQDETQVIDIRLKDIRDSVLRIFNAKYFDKIVGLAKGKEHARSVHNTYFDIISSIAGEDKAEIAVETLRSKIVGTISDPDMRNRKGTSFANCLKYLADVIEARGLSDALYYRKGASYISIEDPSFRFYLNLVDMDQIKSRLHIRNSGYAYDVAVSFAGEIRKTVQEFVDLAKEKGINVFYDFDLQHKIWGKDLQSKLVEVYTDEALYMIIFISEDYPIKDWTSFESEVGRKASEKRTTEYILPIKIDDTPVLGLKGTVGHLDLRQLTVEQIIDILDRKLSDFVD
ncbi:AAA family ATPase [Cytobacillus oceanisediminis]|uniref:AAA family ATPase n=1 Tax=Cytobacillus oceanisediminis TaxID=665099 RepID=UPI0020418BC0|nr:AAA family ATPase [Cytobacillus oceanisediminis]MCM3404826.1 AAA family ATPase [Cytobacillus oceanisediminis]MDK7669365.1 AAA family ATPase [Cytobacillus oceanisediminis]